MNYASFLISMNIARKKKYIDYFCCVASGSPGHRLGSALQGKAASKNRMGGREGGRGEYQALLKLYSDAGKQVKDLEHLHEPIRAVGS